MAIPHDDVLQIQVGCLLLDCENDVPHCNDVYAKVGAIFPILTKDELTIRFGNSISHFANRVQWARKHLVEDGFMEPHYLSGRGYWKLTAKGRAHFLQMRQQAEELLRELDQLH